MPELAGPVRVMQSFGPPRPTTNPYITMLDRALSECADIDHHRFSWRGALLGRYDVFHWHWPEGKLHGSTWWRSSGKYVLTAALVLRHRLSRRIAVVRTVHNIELPDANAARLALLKTIDAGTDHRIVLNEVTRVRAGQERSLILHGHYQDWYAVHPVSPAVHGRIGAFGGIRRYKGLDSLLDAFAESVREQPSLSLHVGGRPSSDQLADDLRRRVSETRNVELTLRFLSDAELVDLATRSQLVVLAYQFMHNSGSVLAALSLRRPVLVPRNEANEALAREVGEDWVLMYDGTLTADALREAWRHAASLPDSAAPDLSRRDWTDAGRAHAAAYRRAASSVHAGAKAIR